MWKNTDINGKTEEKIRSGEGCKEADFPDKNLATEHVMQMRRCDMGVVMLKDKVFLDDLTGIRMEGSGGLHIPAVGEVKLEGQEVNLNGNRGVTMYEGKAVPDLEKLLDAEEGALVTEVAVTAMGKVELSMGACRSELSVKPLPGRVGTEGL